MLLPEFGSGAWTVERWVRGSQTTDTLREIYAQGFGAGEHTANVPNRGESHVCPNACSSVISLSTAAVINEPTYLLDVMCRRKHDDTRRGQA